MRKAKSLIGLNVISQAEGKQLGSVRDLIFDDGSRQLIALLLSDRELFGMIDATIVPWSEVREIGPHAIMVPSEVALQKAHTDPVIAEAFDQKKKLDGKRVTTQGGENLGTISDLYLGNAGNVEGFEVSGGLFADAFSGKRYMAIPSEFTVGADYVLVPQSIALELERQKVQEPGGISGAYQGAAASVTAPSGGLTDKVGELYNSAKAKVTETYDSLAGASVEKQRDFVIGKVASRDVVIAPTQATVATPEQVTTTSVPPYSPPIDVAALEEHSVETTLGMPESTIHPVTYDGVVPMQQPTYATATDITSSGEVVEGEVLIRKGETITATHADRAIAAGVLGQLLFAAAGGVANQGIDSAKTTLSGQGTQAQNSLANSAIGKPAGREVLAPDGAIIVAPGMIITQEILDQADLYGKKNEVIASAGVGAVSTSAKDSYASAKDSAGNLWDSIKEKAAELSGSAQEKKADYDAKAEQNKINNALGRPVTRVILDRNDAIILNTGDLITNAAVNRSRDAGVLSILLDSVFVADPSITPEMLRARDKGEAALDNQLTPAETPLPNPEASSGSSDGQNSDSQQAVPTH